MASEPGTGAHRYFRGRSMHSCRVWGGRSRPALGLRMEGAQEAGTVGFWMERTQGVQGTGTVSPDTPAQ